MTFAISDTMLWDKINNAFGNRGGVYKVIAIKNEAPITINRLLGADTNGVLYIGKAISYLDRVITLKKSLDPVYISSNHDFGVRHKKHSLITEQFPYEILFVELLESENPNDLERKELNEYYDKFGELPPMNRLQ